MFPPTPGGLAEAALVHDPVSTTSPGAAWLVAIAARAAQVEQQLAEGHRRDNLLTLHAHYAIEDPHHDLRKVAADLRMPLCHRATDTGHGFAAQVALFRVARRLLDELTAVEPKSAA